MRSMAAYLVQHTICTIVISPALLKFKFADTFRKVALKCMPETASNDSYHGPEGYPNYQLQ